MKTLEYFFDFSSSYSYLADSQIEAVAARHGATLRWVPMALGGVFKATGNSMPASIPSKAQYMAADLNRWAIEYGIPFQFPSVFPVPSISAMRLVLVAQRDAADQVPALVHACFAAAWGQGRNIGELPVLAEIAAAVGLPADALEKISAPEIKEQLMKNGEEAVARGVFGAPTLFVGDQLFWGNDRLHHVEAALTK